MRGGALAAALRRDRAIVLAALLLLAALAWSYVIWLAAQMNAPVAAGMSSMPGMTMDGGGAMFAAHTGWASGYFLYIFTMWAVMMIGMMTPTVMPMVLIYARVAQQDAATHRRVAPAGWFAAGYLAAWTLFALIAAFAQWGIERLALLTPMMASENHRVGGSALIAVGIYQWLPIKDACLSQCRSPLSFMQRNGGFQPGARGSLRLGFLHGLYCVGCCWALMAVLFVVGVMNLLWIAALMFAVLLEKIIPGGRYFARFTGAGAIAAGIWMICRD